LLFGGFIAGAPLSDAAVTPSLRGFAVGYRFMFYGLMSGLFYYFFAVFPTASPSATCCPSSCGAARYTRCGTSGR
jgi:hypothetical protein